MSDVFDKARALLQCKSCPWYTNCVMPMRVTEEDLKRQLETPIPGNPMSEETGEISQLLSTMASAAQNSLLEGCPVFIMVFQTLNRNQIRVGFITIAKRDGLIIASTIFKGPTGRIYSRGRQ